MSSGLDDRVFEVAADLFGLLAAPTRLRIVCVLIEGERNVTELLDRVAVSQPNMSQHLGTLYRAGVLARRRCGAQVRYRVDSAQVRSLCEALQGQLGSAAARPAAGTDRHCDSAPEERP